MATNFTTKNISSIELKNVKYNLKSIPLHATEAEWNMAPLFEYIPKEGEIIVYDIDDNYNYERVKIGDGVTTTINLPFYLAEEIGNIKVELAKKIEVSYDDASNTLVFTN